jgi:hypothetical protein
VSRPGVVLVAVLFALLAGALLATAALFVSAQEVVITNLWTASLRARLAAESGVAVALQTWHAEDFRRLHPGGSAPPYRGTLPDGTGYETTVERLADDRYLIRSLGSPAAGRPAARATVGFLVRTISPGAFLADFPAALTAGGDVQLLAGTVVSSLGGGVSLSPTDPDCPWPEDLEAEPGAPALLLPPEAGLAVAAGAILLGDPPVARVALPGDGSGPGLGPLDEQGVARLADRTESGSIRLYPATLDGACDRHAQGNWGDPRSPGSPCSAYFPLIHAPGHLVVESGAGQGVLVVHGDLSLGPGVEFHGAVVAGGSIRAEVGARIAGAVRAGARGATLDGAEILLDRCALLRSFRHAPGLNRPFREARAWVPLF